ncbi:MAG: hypothetical protein KC486_31115, partial [Myxococcales bacterium]|nr:hypothetical protein [Myxococcales bacterium]
MAELAAGPQLDIWRLERALETCHDEDERRELHRRKNAAQQQLARDPAPVGVGESLPLVPGLDWVKALDALRSRRRRRSRRRSSPPTSATV